MKKTSKAILFMLLSAVSFTAMGYFVKDLSQLPVALKVLFRNGVIFFLLGIPMGIESIKKRSANLFLGPPKSRWTLLLRSFLGFMGVVLYFFALGELTLGESSALNRTSPFFVLVFAHLFLGERIKPHHIIFTALGFTGALLIIKPGLSPALIPALAGLGAGAFAGGAYTTIRSLSGKADPRTIVIWFAGFSFLGILPLAISDLHLVFENPQFLWGLMGIGIFAGLGQVFLTLAYQLEKAGEISVYNYTHIVLSLVLDQVVIGQTPDAWSILGTCCILIAGVGMFLMRRSGARTPDKTEDHQGGTHGS